MARNSIVLGFICFVFFPYSCTSICFNRDSFIGTYMSQDGGKLVLNEDGTFVVNNLNYYYFFSEQDAELSIVKQNQTNDLSGKWYHRYVFVEDSHYIQCIFDSLYTIDGCGTKYNIVIECDTRLQFSHKAQLVIYKDISDPDSFNTYDLYKQ